jgi:FAD/FMN-containing dehydrogenase
MPTCSNWSGTVRTSPAVIATPATVKEVVDVLTHTQQYPSPVRAVGNFFSTTDCAAADSGTLVDMTRMCRVIEITDDSVHVEAGAIYKDVADALARRGKGFFVDLQVGNATLGSVATCATKDGSFPGEHGQAGAYVTRIKWVTAAGEIRETDDRDAELFTALRSSYGLLGVVVEVTIRIRSLEPISIRHVNYTTEGFLDALPELRRRNGSLCFYLFPFADRVTAQLRGPATPAARLNRWVWRFRNFAVAYAVPLGTRCANLVPVRAWRYGLISAFDVVARWALARLLHAEHTLPADQITRYARRPKLARFTFSIFAFPEDRYARVLREYRQFCADHDAEHGYRPDLLSIGYRVAKSRHALFSYSWDGDVMTIDPVATGGPEWDRFADRFNEFCIARGGKPLLNQTPRLTAMQMRAAFAGRVDRFNELRRALDPGERLLNEPLRRLLG